MKTTLFTAAVLVAAGAVCAVAGELGETEVSARWLGIMPQRDQDWSSAGGIELQARFWSSENIGWAVSAGLENWAARYEFLEEWDEEGYSSLSVGGDLAALPAGVSVLFQPMLTEDMRIVAEIGLRYMLCSSDIVSAAYLEDSQGTDSFLDPVEVGNAVVGIAGLSFEGTIDDDIRLSVGLGYQFDIMPPAETVAGRDIGNTSFAGMALSIGVSWSF